MILKIIFYTYYYKTTSNNEVDDQSILHTYDSTVVETFIIVSLL